ncbi:hypothetical protein M899_2112 [Bacteriovorax sp. BSW11_IV]|nr:hypothetical protein M899_2112 [Bacteriovorax sp. BSW11_IV]
MTNNLTANPNSAGISEEVKDCTISIKSEFWICLYEVKKLFITLLPMS